MAVNVLIAPPLRIIEKVRKIRRSEIKKNVFLIYLVNESREMV